MNVKPGNKALVLIVQGHLSCSGFAMVRRLKNCRRELIMIMLTTSLPAVCFYYQLN